VARHERPASRPQATAKQLLLDKTGRITYGTAWPQSFIPVAACLQNRQTVCSQPSADETPEGVAPIVTLAEERETGFCPEEDRSAELVAGQLQAQVTRMSVPRASRENDPQGRPPLGAALGSKNRVGT